MFSSKLYTHSSFLCDTSRFKTVQIAAFNFIGVIHSGVFFLSVRQQRYSSTVQQHQTSQAHIRTQVERLQRSLFPLFNLRHPPGFKPHPEVEPCINIQHQASQMVGEHPLCLTSLICLIVPYSGGASTGYRVDILQVAMDSERLGYFPFS